MLCDTKKKKKKKVHRLEAFDTRETCWQYGCSNMDSKMTSKAFRPCTRFVQDTEFAVTEEKCHIQDAGTREICQFLSSKNYSN